MTSSMLPGLSPRADVLTVTPELAAEWLSRNTHNRPIRKTTVANYARDMVAGQWAMNGESVKFAADGTLLDGQHRLTAVTVAGVAVQMLVITGLANETQSTMDAGTKRTTGDAFSLDGQKNAQMLAAILKKVWMWERGDHRFAANYTPTTAECQNLLAKHPEIHRSVEIALRVRSTFRAIPPSVTGVAHHAFTGIEPSEATWFFQRLGDGATLSIGHPVLTLRARLTRDREARLHVPDHRVMAYLVASWNAVRDGRSLSKIQISPDGPMVMPR